MNIAFLGLGAMGAPMAMNLAKAKGHNLRVYNRGESGRQPFVEQGILAFDTPREAVIGADVAFSMVTDDEASRAIWLDPMSGALGGLRAGGVAVVCSTLSPGWVRTLGASIKEAGVAMVEAPVVGSRPQATGGSLIALLGGQEGDIGRVASLLDVLCAGSFYCGALGAGAVMKLAVNAYFAIQVAALGQLLPLATRGGVEEGRAVEILGSLPITGPALKGILGAMAARRFAPLFPIDLVEKDLGYGVQAGGDLGLNLPSLEAARRVYAQAQVAGLGGDNIHGVMQLFEDKKA